jgi:hypothetical protein
MLQYQFWLIPGLFKTVAKFAYAGFDVQYKPECQFLPVNEQTKR